MQFLQILCYYISIIIISSITISNITINTIAITIIIIINITQTRFLFCLFGLADASQWRGVMLHDRTCA